MNKTRYSLDRALRLLGERWTLLIIREACRGPFRFDEICLKLGISRTTLALRLRTLQEEKILKTSPVPNEPNRQYYMLGERGEGLRTVIDRIADWSEGREFDN
ncbi:MAG: helix-turn-helix transcriptional regulator [Sneathiellales bacterium]|nr:helix-turn-helix transcriptional regulator [Sneathiellales bacterium]